jgi:hypothetical protein
MGMTTMGIGGIGKKKVSSRKEFVCWLCLDRLQSQHGDDDDHHGDDDHDYNTTTTTTLMTRTLDPCRAGYVALATYLIFATP